MYYRLRLIKIFSPQNTCGDKYGDILQLSCYIAHLYVLKFKNGFI